MRATKEFAARPGEGRFMAKLLQLQADVFGNLYVYVSPHAGAS
jgi:hypothetical protein